MNFKISVIIPVYNAKEDIAQAIDSIINQTIGFDNIELILVDDASTDNTKEIIKTYQNKHDNIKLIELNQNSGLPGKPRSTGIDYATSDYIIFLEQFDSVLNLMSRLIHKYYFLKLKNLYFLYFRILYIF